MAASTPPQPAKAAPRRPARPIHADALPLVRLRGLRRAATQGNPALRGLDLDIAGGEFVTLLGPAGAGKSTALLLLAGFLRPDGGTIHLDSCPITRTPAHRRGIGVVLRDPGLLPHLTVAQNVALPLRLRGVARPARAERIGHALDLAGLPGLGDRLPARLSPAQQCRAALARALVFAPPLLLLEAPFAALDSAARAELRATLRALHREHGFTVLLATDDQAEALALSDRIAILAGGMLRQCATPRDLYESPANAFVAGYLGAANLLPGVFVRPQDDLAEIHLDCGVAVEARPINAVRGQRCVVAIRPERVAIAATSAEEMGDGALPVTVEDVIYQGDHASLRLRVGAPGARPAILTVHRPAGAPMMGLEPGRSAAAAWQPHHASAFRPEPA